MERLTVKWTDKVYDTFDPVDVVDNEYSKANYNKILTKLGEYEDLEEQGRLIKLPCDKVYYIIDKNNPKYAAVMSKTIRDLTVYEIENIDIEVQDYVKKLVNVVTKTIVDSFENLTIEDVNMFKLGYNKAVDDLTANITERFSGMAMSSGLPTEGATWENAIRQVKQIAEQLKGAKQNEDFKQEEM